MAVFVFLMKTMVVFVTLFLLYNVFLKNTTFLRFRRGYLIATLFLSFLIPWVSTLLLPKYYISEPESILSQIDGMVRHFAFTNRLSESHDMINMMAAIVLGVGFVLVTVKYTFSLKAIYGFLKGSHLVSKNKQYTLRAGNKGNGCFCFLKTIYLCSPSLNEQNINIILEHEKAHIQQKHYLDIFLSAICDFFLWFYPFIRQFQLAWEEVLECLADREAIRALQIAPITYQSVLFDNMEYTNMTSSFNHAFGRSLIAKRLLFISRKPTQKRRILQGLFFTFIAVGIITIALAFMDTQLFQLRKIKEIRNAGYNLHDITTGYVLDIYTEKPVNNAIVKGDDTIAVTDSDGFFFMKTSSQLNIRHIAYSQTNFFTLQSIYKLCPPGEPAAAEASKKPHL